MGDQRLTGKIGAQFQRSLQGLITMRPAAANALVSRDATAKLWAAAMAAM
jgi:hypothetical protein